MAEAGFADYIKHAFLQYWNLGLLGAGIVASAIFPAHGAELALVAALEASYLTIMLGLPAFRAAVDAQVHKSVSTEHVESGKETLDAALGPLSFPARARFDNLLGRCNRMRDLAESVHAGAQGVERLRTSGMDQLLWGFVRMLSHQEALAKLVDSMDRDEIEKTIRDIKGYLSRPAVASDERLKNSYSERLATAQGRLTYATQCRRDLDFLVAELDRVEDNIGAIAEKTVSRGNLDVLSAEIDAAAKSVTETEQTIGTWQSTVALPLSGDAPVILDAARAGVTSRA